MNMQNINIIITEPETIFSAGLKMLLQQSGKYNITADCVSRIQAVTPLPGTIFIILWTEKDEQVLMKTIAGLRHTGRHLPVLIITLFRIRNEHIQQIIALGNTAIASAAISGRELHNYIEQLHNGSQWLLSRDIQETLLEQLLRHGTAKNAAASDLFSAKEKKIIALAQRGCNIIRTAKTLNLSPNTVASYRSKMLKKAGVHSMAELLEKYNDSG
ncbi:MAG: hypothetical protein BGO09_15050 [Bacteroidetes bacterium 47-18]|nr:MAG: hypothetical protein BGO09_15050 [Bacteroidetes bacterium 47-18]